jgi:hypothetical protein
MELGGKQINSRLTLAIQFNGTDQQKKGEGIVGGMRNRVHLAIALRQAETCCCWTNLPMIWM